MDIAFKLHNLKEGVSGGYDVITASELRKLGKSAARELNFVCAQAGCNIRMLPVFPEAIGKDGKVLECHFRAHPGTYHKGHGTHQKPIDATTPSVEKTSSIGNKPSGWRDPTPPQQHATSQPKVGIGSPANEEKVAGLPRTKSTSATSGMAPSRTSSLRKLVERWESEQPGIRHSLFAFPGRKDATWNDVFVRIGTYEFEQEFNKQRRCIFYGNVSCVRAWGAKAFEIEFAEHASNRVVTCYVKMPPDLKATHPVLASSLKRQARTANGRAYVLGTINNWSSDAIKIAIESCDYIWVVD